MINNYEFNNSSKLIDQDRDIYILTDFLKQLTPKKRGILRVVANEESGAKHFLNIASDISLKHNYEVININEYRYDKLIDKLKNFSIKEYQNIESDLLKKTDNSKTNGQIIIIDNIDQIDKDTINVIDKLLSSETNYVIALIYSTQFNLTTIIDYIDIPIYRTIFLEPLSPKGFYQFFTTELEWDKPPRILLEYLYNKTNGLPKYIKTEIEFLIEKEILIYDSQKGWSTNEVVLTILVNEIRNKNKFFPRNNLPSETTEFVGREEEIRKIYSLLEKARLVTLIGPGGIGKSRLALKVALLCLSKYNDGVFWISLSEITKTKLLISHIAKVLNIPEIKGHNTLDSIKSTLKNKKMLIVLDNFEQIIDSAKVLAEMLTVAADFSILVTSRQPLKLYGEHLFSIPPLEIPDLKSSHDLEVVEKQPSISLFLSRAKAIKNDFSITEENASKIAKLCAFLEGIPLAIELAAANIDKISIQSMLNQNQNRLSWLIDGANNLPDRQRTMKKTILWGYNLLSTNQKRIFIKIGVFKGKFNIKAAQAVINKNNGIENLYDELLCLTNKSMLMIDSKSEEEGLIFNMLETIREYAVELLSTDSEKKFIKKCHADYYFSYALDAKKNFYRSNRQKSFSMLDGTYLDISYTLEHYISTNCFEKELELAVSLGYYWEARGYWDRGQNILKSIIQRQDNFSNVKLLVKAYQWYGRFVSLNGNHKGAVDIFEKGLALAMENNDLMGEAAIRYNLALANNISGNLQYEVELLNQSLSIYREADYKHGIAEVLQELGQVYYFKGSYDKAEMCLNESLSIYKKCNDRYGILRVYGRMGLVLRSKGEFTEAMQMFHKYLLSCEEIKDRVEIAFALINIAELARSQGDNTVAQSYYLKSLNIGYELGYRSIIAYIKKELGEIYHYMGQLNKAYELFNESLSILNETGYKGDVPWVYRNLAELELDRGNYLKAEELFIIGLKIYIEIKQNTLSYIFLIFEGLATVSTMLEDYNRASCLYSAADKLFQTVGNLLAVDDINSFRNRLNNLRDKMDIEAFDSSWNEGHSMSLECAIEYALKDNKYDRSMANKMINYIHENYINDVSLNDISEYFNMSSSYLSTMFKYYTGQNFKDYLNLYRVKISKELMTKEENLKIYEIAQRVGCSGVVTFIRMFKRYEGISPGQYYSQLIRKSQ